MTEENNNLVEQLEEMAGMGIDISIEDGAFIIRPSDAGIALLAAIQSHDSEMEETWTAVDDMADTVEELRKENSLFRQLLLDVVDIFSYNGMEREATIINRTLWKVRGINENGDVVDFEWQDDIDPDGPFGWLAKNEFDKMAEEQEQDQ